MIELPQSVRNRLAATAASDAGVHPDAELLAAFREQSLTEGERRRVVTHLAQCGLCREVVALALPPLSSAAPAPVATRRGWFAVPQLFRWGTGLAALVVVSAALWLHRSEPNWLTWNRQFAKIASQSAASAAPAESAPAPVPAPPAAAPRDTHIAKRAPRQEPGRTEPTAPVRSYAAGLDASGSRIESNDAFRAAGVPPPPPSPPAAAVGGTASRPAMATAGPPPNPAYAPGGDRALPNEGSAKYAAAQSSRADAVARKRVTEQSAMAALTQREAVRAEERAPASKGIAAKASPAPFFWSISPEGKLQRSSDQLAWQTVEVAAGVSFRSVAHLGPNLWAGGSGGALYHSSDGGSTWQRVPVGEPQQPVQDAITRLGFANPLAGTVTTSRGEQWSTADGGRTWSQSPAK